jgi:hypothetical protein
MGMFDEIVCDAALPDRDWPTGTCFQTKSFPDPCMSRYRITPGGRLIDADGNDVEPDGYISFYTTEPAERNGLEGPGSLTLREYRARFASGQLQDIVRVDGIAGDHLRYGLASYRWFQTRSFTFCDADDEPA